LSEMKQYNREYEGAIPVEIYQDIKRATNLLEQARTEYSNRGLVLDVERPDPMAVAISILRGVQAQLERLQKQQERGEKRSLASLYIGVFLGALIGVVGNFFVSFWFQEVTKWNILGLIVSGVILFLVCVALWLEVRKYGA